MLDIPIIVAGYNRPDALNRILTSLLNALYTDSVELKISIDGGDNSGVVKVAEKFKWPFGHKEVIRHEKNLGLRNHILFCGSLSKDHDGIILLEDDLFVSPNFYRYAISAAHYYDADPELAGIALYSHQFNETAYLPFYPIDDESDVFFMQLPCSWGQLWLSHQWEEFEKWYGQNQSLNINQSNALPPDIRKWPETSWKKYYTCYLIEKKKFFVYPRSSLTTNFGNAGQHHSGSKLFQVPLETKSNRDYFFVKRTNSPSCYDAFCELLPHCFVSLCPELEEFDFEVDLYGMKENQFIYANMILTSKNCKQHIKSYGKELIPLELNIVYRIEGDDFFLAHSGNAEDVIDALDYRFKILSNTDEIKYFYNIENMHFAYYNQQIKRNDLEIEQCKKNNIQLRKKVEKGTITIDRLSSDLQEYSRIIHQLKNSYSYRIGKIIIYPFSYIKKIFHRQ